MLILAGEKSGEEHLLSFFSDLQNKFSDYSFWGVGGDQAEQMGLKLTYHLREFGSMGVSDVLGKLPFYFKAMDRIVSEAVSLETEAAILIDFQDFNLRLAKKLSKKGVKVFYYVAPQAWVWRPSRAKQLREFTDHLFCILPFEKKWFSRRGVTEISSVLHPVYKKIDSEGRWNSQDKEKNEILLLPGSRNSEVLKTLPVFLEALSNVQHDLTISIVKTTSVKKEVYEAFDEKIDKSYDSSDLYEALENAKICLAASGTATLSCSLMGVPTIVGYKVSLLNELFYRVFVPYKGYIALANLIAEKEVFPELIQDRFTSFEIEKILAHWVSNQRAIDEISKKAKLVRERFILENVNVVETIYKKLKC